MDTSSFVENERKSPSVELNIDFTFIAVKLKEGERKEREKNVGKNSSRRKMDVYKTSWLFGLAQ